MALASLPVRVSTVVALLTAWPMRPAWLMLVLTTLLLPATALPVG